jgi:hypothetical protein
MGIRFKCSHCQKRLNVKAAQAGQSGQCPKCGKTVQIPLQSEVAPVDTEGHTEVMDSHSIFDVDNQITQAGLSASIHLETETRLGNVNHPLTSSGRSRTKRRRSQTGSDEPFLLDKPRPPATLGRVDPIAQAPRKIWYFRSRELGEKGPLKARAMRNHVDQGDVTIGCIVWREDWEDWQPAERVFPELAEELRKQAAELEPEPGVPDEWNPHAALQRRRRRLQMLGIVAIAAGLVTIFGLAVLLVKLISN